MRAFCCQLLCQLLLLRIAGFYPSYYSVRTEYTEYAPPVLSIIARINKLSMYVYVCMYTHT